MICQQGQGTTSLYNGLTRFTTTSVQSSKCLNCPGYIHKQNLASKVKASRLRTSTAGSPHITEEIPLLNLTAISKTTCSDCGSPPDHVQHDILDLETLDSEVPRLRDLVRTVVSGLLHKVDEALGEGLIGVGLRCAGIFGHSCVVVGI